MLSDWVAACMFSFCRRNCDGKSWLRTDSSIEENSVADMVIWSGDPLEVTSVADQVIIGGKMDPMISRQTLLRDRYLPENTELPRAYVNP